MFKRKKPAVEDHGFRSEEAPALLGAAPEPAVPEARTTCYPQDGDAPPPVAGQPRTTVYRQGVRWNRGGYDTVN
ncbi:MAG: hypothetical protein ACRDYV_04480 [Acidimicrobiia bacterium]